MTLVKKISLVGMGVVALFSAIASMQSALARQPYSGEWMEEIYTYNGVFVKSVLNDTRCSNGGIISYAYGAGMNASSPWNERVVKMGPC